MPVSYTHLEQKLFDIKVLLCKYTQQVSKGEINDIHFDNIQVLNGDIPVSLIRGYQTPTEEVRVHDITFDNITFMGKKCETWQDLRLSLIHISIGIFNRRYY